MEQRLDALTLDQSRICIHGMVIIADRMYASINVLKSLIGSNSVAVMIMPENLLRSHPFCRTLHLVSSSADEEIDWYYHVIDALSDKT